MKIVTAILVSRVVPGWPDQVIRDDVPLGREYRINLDALGVATLQSQAHPEWGTREVEAVQDIDGAGPLPTCCLRIVAPLPESPALYEVAREVCHAHGFDWTDPRTGVTYPPPSPGDRES